MSKWKDGQLDLGALGGLEVIDVGRNQWRWDWLADRFYVDSATGILATEAAAQRAAERWLRAALRQASKRIG